METEPAWYTPHATAACRLAVARDRNPQRPRGLLEPSAGTMPSTGLCRVDIAERMSGLVEAVDVLAGSAYS